MKTKNGDPVTDEMLEKWAQVFEDGTWPKGRTTRVGRPSLSTEQVKPITFRLPVSWIKALDKKAAENGLSRSAGLRLAVEEYIAKQ